jgi:magnesium chelatase family protein
MGNQGKLSGPLLDRIDLHVQVGALPQEALLSPVAGECSDTVRERVEQAYGRQQARQGKANHHLTVTEIERHCVPEAAGEQLLRQAMTRLNWSARGYHRVLKVARTIADLEASNAVKQTHIAEAIQYRRGLQEA